MRTTLTLDDDLARQLKEIARRSGRPFKQVVNDALRRSLASGEKPLPRAPRFVVEARACGFRRGVDPLKLNQLSDELEIEEFGIRSSPATPCATPGPGWNGRKRASCSPGRATWISSTN